MPGNDSQFFRYRFRHNNLPGRLQLQPFDGLRLIYTRNSLPDEGKCFLLLNAQICP